MTSNDEEGWDTPFRPEDTRGLVEEGERHDDIARALRRAMPVERRLRVIVSRKPPLDVGSGPSTAETPSSADTE